MPRKGRRHSKTQKPDEQHTDSDTMEENQPPQQESEETETAQAIEKKKLIKVLLEEDKEEEVLEWIKANPTYNEGNSVVSHSEAIHQTPVTVSCRKMPECDGQLEFWS